MIYLLDSQDSFTYNIATIFQSFGAQVIVQDTRFINWATIEEQDSGIAAFILSPGPGKPEEEKYFMKFLKDTLEKTHIGRLFGAPGYCAVFWSSCRKCVPNLPWKDVKNWPR